MNKINKIKSIIETLSEPAIKIWAQHLWEHRFVKTLNTKDPNVEEKYKIIDQLWDHCGETYHKKTGLPSYFISDFPSMKKFGKYPWLNYNREVKLELLDDNGFLISTVKHQTSHIDDGFLYLKPVSHLFPSRYGLKGGDAEGYYEQSIGSKIRLDAMDLVRARAAAGIT